MHIYTGRLGCNIPEGCRRLLKVVGGDSVEFTSVLRVPKSDERLTGGDLAVSDVRLVLAENRFCGKLWSGSYDDGWVTEDPNVPGLFRFRVPRTVTSLLRRGVYAFSVVVDDGVSRETQVTGNIQVEYEPGSPTVDIPYRADQYLGGVIVITPELDRLVQDNHRCTYDEVVKAVSDVARVLVGRPDVEDAVTAVTENIGVSDVEDKVAYMARVIMSDDTLRAKVVQCSADVDTDPTFDEVVSDVVSLLEELRCRGA